MTCSIKIHNIDTRLQILLSARVRTIEGTDAITMRLLHQCEVRTTLNTRFDLFISDPYCEPHLVKYDDFLAL